MKALIIGGDRHGEFVETLDGVQAWVDIRTATTHRIRQITNTVTELDAKGNQTVTEAHVIYLAIHEQLAGHPDEMQIAMTALQTFALNAFTREHGKHLDIPKEPASADLIVPGPPESWSEYGR